jgi:hypothetical protein
MWKGQLSFSSIAIFSIPLFLHANKPSSFTRVESYCHVIFKKEIYPSFAKYKLTSLFNIAIPVSGLLSNGHWRPFPREYSRKGVKLTTGLHLAPRSRMMELYLLCPPYVFVTCCLINYAKGQLCTWAVTGCSGKFPTRGSWWNER